MLYEHGITCVDNVDGPGMISTGWALWWLSGLNQHQANDFIQDGYREWRKAGAPAQERMEFLQAVMARLAYIQPAIPPTANLEIIPRGGSPTASCGTTIQHVGQRTPASQPAHQRADVELVGP